jgi:hypothetical protein
MAKSGTVGEPAGRDPRKPISLEIIGNSMPLIASHLAIRMRPTEQKELTSLFEMDGPVGAFASAKYVETLPTGW